MKAKKEKRAKIAGLHVNGKPYDVPAVLGVCEERLYELGVRSIVDRRCMAYDMWQTGIVFVRQRHPCKPEYRSLILKEGWTHDYLIEKLGEAW